MSSTTCLTLYVFDSYGDGMCCGYGQGYFQVWNEEGGLIVSNDGDFDDEAVESFVPETMDVKSWPISMLTMPLPSLQQTESSPSIQSLQQMILNTASMVDKPLGIQIHSADSAQVPTRSWSKTRAEHALSSKRL